MAGNVADWLFFAISPENRLLDDLARKSRLLDG
jgi:hypothetical protein